MHESTATPLGRPFPWLAVLLLLAACAPLAPEEEPPWREATIPAGRDLVRDGLTPAGDLAVVLARDPAGCRVPEAWRREGRGWRLTTAAPAIAWPGCPLATARLAANGRTLAVYDVGGGRASVLTVTAETMRPAGTAILTSPAGAPFPPPGPNVALDGDGRSLLLGASGRACRRDAEGLVCGVAELHAFDGAGWRRRALLMAPEEARGVRFGQAVALAADAGLAIVGGTGEPGHDGGLWVFSLRGEPPRVVQELRPPRKDGLFAHDLTLTADGSWLAVAGERAVHLYRREDDAFAFAQRLTAPPDPSIGHFAETVAFSADGRSLLVGAPRSFCAAGERCGRAFLYRLGRSWQLAREIRPAEERAEAGFGHRLALDANGRTLAVQGAAIHLLTAP